MPTRATLLEGIVKRFQAELNMTPVGAVELEFFLMDRASALAGNAACAAIADQRVPARSTIRPITCRTSMISRPSSRTSMPIARRRGLPAKTLISEYAPGQMEIVLRHRADVLKACDEAIMLKRLIKATAEKHGLIATFMAKPYAQWTGSGMHIHVSLGDEQGNNLFATDDPMSNELLLHAIGGLKATMAESMLIFAPNANSYRRFRRNSYAPVSASWGINNRTVSHPHSGRRRHRPATSSTARRVPMPIPIW